MTDVNRKITAGQALGELVFEFDENSKFLLNRWTDMEEMHERGDDELLIDDIFEDEGLEE